MPTYGKIEPFEAEGSEEALRYEWVAYEEQIEQFFLANEITDAQKKRSIFLAACGSKIYKLLRNLCSPESPANKSYMELMTCLRSHFSPVPNVIVERFHFHTRVRHVGESISTFLAELRRLSVHCNFGAVLEDMIRDRLVCGVNDAKIQERLFAEPRLDYKAAVEIALAMEAASRDMTYIKKNSQVLMSHEKVDSLEVNRLKLLPKTDRNRQGWTPDNGVQLNDEKIICYRCGNGHKASVCRFSRTICNKCRKVGHIAKVCRSSGPEGKEKGMNKPPKVSATNNIEVLSQEDIDEYSENVYDLMSLTGAYEPPIKMKMKYKGKVIEMEVDCGAAISVISEATVKEKWGKGVKLEPSEVVVRAYFGEKIEARGALQGTLEFKGKNYELPLVVVPGKGRTLLGRNWIRILKLLPGLNELNRLEMQGNTSGALDILLGKYSDLFDGNLGTLKGVEAKIVVPADVKPKFFKARPVPYSMRKKIDIEIDRLVAEGILTPVKYSNWASPIVPTSKPDGTVRVCGDFKVSINPVSTLEQYPLPRIDDLFAKLAGGKRFSKIDLSDAYFQMKLAEESQEYVTINTMKGLFRYVRLPPGVSSAPAIFQRAVEGLLADIEQVATFFDDFLVTGANDQEHLARLEMVFSRLRKAGLKLKKEKCVFLQKQIEYLGYRIDAEGLHPLNNKVEAIQNAPAPTTVKQLQAYLGMLNHYRRFLPNLSQKLTLLYELLQGDREYKWTPAHQEVFETSKALLTSKAVLVHFDPQQEIVVSCDASPYGLGAVISHRFADGTERPVAFASRTLAAAERNYSQLDKEALGLIFAITKFHQYLFGHHFEFQTDHQPLLGLFKAGKAIPTISSPRILRWAIKLSSYEYSLVYKPGKQNAIADALSRVPLEQEPTTVPRPQEVFMLEKEYPQLLSAKSIAKYTNRDPTLAAVRTLLWSGTQILGENNHLRPYANRQSELCVQESCVLWGTRVVVPRVLQLQTLELLHEGHPGITRMKQIARQHVWWPKIDEEIEVLVRGCQQCQATRKNPPAIPMNPWPFPGKPWSRIHVDHAGPYKGKIFFIVTDAYSKWIEVMVVPSTSTEATIKCLRTIFASHGIPDLLVSDNGAAFSSHEFQVFLRNNGIKKLAVPPYHPSSNGAAERVVQTVKEKLKLVVQGDWETRLARFLLHYRTQVHSTTGVSPAELLQNRKLKTVLSCMRPNLNISVQTKQLQQKLRSDKGSQDRTLGIGNPVYIRNFREGDKWVRGVIEKENGKNIFQVRTDVGFLWNRHGDHIRNCTESEGACMSAGDLGSGTEAQGLNGGGKEQQEHLMGVSEPLNPIVDSAPESLVVPLAPNLRRSSRTIKPPMRLDL